MTGNSHDARSTRRSLLLRLKDWEDQEGWREFFDTYWKLIYGVAITAGLKDAEAQDVVQETAIAVARQMSHFKVDPEFGSFKSWLLLITRRRIADQFRKRLCRFQTPRHRADETTRTSTVGRIPDPASLALESVWEERWKQNLLDAAIANVKRRVSPRQYLIFHQLVIKELPPRQVAAKYGVSLAQVYVAKYRISGLIKKEVRKLEKKRI